MGLSWWHILLVLLVFVLLFGTGKISGFMADLAKGIKGFKKEMAEGEAEPEEEPKAIEHQPAAPRKTKPSAAAKAPRKRKTN